MFRDLRAQVHPWRRWVALGLLLMAMILAVA